MSGLQRVNRETRVWLQASAGERMLELASRAEPEETGGLLLGYWGGSQDEVVVVEATPPGPQAVETEDAFTPDYEHDRQVVAQRHRSSGGRITYLGDWHSHPESEIAPSIRDLRTLRRIADVEAAQVKIPIMALVGGDKAWGISVWAWWGTHGFLWWKEDVVEPVEVQLYEDVGG